MCSTMASTSAREKTPTHFGGRSTACISSSRWSSANEAATVFAGSLVAVSAAKIVLQIERNAEPFATSKACSWQNA